MKPDLAAAMGNANRTAVRAYAWPNIIDRVEAAYAAVMESADDR
jgi:hypothetical protein